jgi:hypothetical protein
MAESDKPCDPCQWKERGSKEPCGWADGTSIRAHLKAHKVGGKPLTVAQYTKKFPKAELGPPANRPTPKHVETLQSARESLREPITDREQSDTVDAIEIARRAESLWDLVNRDPTAERLCYYIAQDEATLDRLYERDVAERRKGLPDSSELQAVAKEIETVQKRLGQMQKAANLTPEQRHKNNTLGEGVGAEIISNFAEVERRWKPEQRNAFRRHVEMVRAKMIRRVNENILSNVPDTQLEQRGASNDEDALLRIRDHITAYRDSVTEPLEE